MSTGHQKEAGGARKSQGRRLVVHVREMASVLISLIRVIETKKSRGLRRGREKPGGLGD